MEGRADDSTLCMFAGAAGFSSPEKLDWKDLIFILDLCVDMTVFMDIGIIFHTAIWEVDTKVSPLIQLTLKPVSSFSFDVFER